MLQQPREPNQQHTCLNNEQNRIESIHVGTINRTESTIDMPERQTKPDQKQTCRNNQQNRINNRHVATMNKTESTTHMPEQQTKQDQKQTCRNKLAANQNDVSSKFHYAEPLSTF
jgi:hypothetical protein